MAFFRRRSLGTKTAIPYGIVTILNITIFVIMVFENQTDLISDNAVLNSEMKGINLKFRTDNILKGQNELTKSLLVQVLKEGKSLGIAEITVMEENGQIRYEIRKGKVTNRKKASAEELRWLNRAITRSNFEDKIFTHRIDRERKEIELYVPVAYGLDKILVLRPLLYMKDIDRSMKLLLRQCILIGVFLVVAHTGLGILFAKVIIRPIRELNNATAQIAMGDLSARVDILRNDEIGQLAISFNEMTVALARMQEQAKGANPLSGLPGNTVIVNEIERRLKEGVRFAVLYCDLDNFKAYNDKYGFTRGDEVILYTRDCLIEAARKKSKEGVFIGHEGGDDFVMVTSMDVWEEIAKCFISSFDHGIAQFYNEGDAKNRYIESVNRQGIPMRFPLVGVSVAVVSNERRHFQSHSEVVSVATEMKKFVKCKAGSCYAIDRRSDPPRGGYPVKPLAKDTILPQGPFPPGVKPMPVYDRPAGGLRGTAQNPRP